MQKSLDIRPTRKQKKRDRTKIQQTFSKMNALRRQNIRPQQTFERWTLRTQESPRELVCQSEAKRKQAPQSEANVCRQWKCNLKKNPSLINCTGHPTQIRGCVLVPRTQLQTQGDTCQYWNANHTISQGFEPDITFQQKRLYNPPWVFFLKRIYF